MSSHISIISWSVFQLKLHHLTLAVDEEIEYYAVFEETVAGPNSLTISCICHAAHRSCLRLTENWFVIHSTTLNTIVGPPDFTLSHQHQIHIRLGDTVSVFPWPLTYYNIL